MSTVTFEAVANYPWCGDGTPENWAAAALDRAIDRDEIHGGDVVGAWMGGWLPIILFTFKFSLTCADSDAVPFDVVMLGAESLAESIVGEADVKVLGVKAVAS